MLAACFVVLGAISLVQASAARGAMLEAKDLLESAKSEVATVPLAQTTAVLDRAHRLVSDAERRVFRPELRVLAALPIAGRSPRAAQGIARASRLSVEAARLATTGLASLAGPDGRLAVKLSGGIDGSAWSSAHVRLAEAARRSSVAVGIVERLPTTWIPGSLRAAGSQVVDAVSTLHRQLENATHVTALAPSMLGAGEPRRYVIVLQNLAEARATGGLIGGFAVVEARDGRLHLAEVAPNYELTRVKDPVPMPDWYRRRYDQFASREFWSNVNMEPDFRVTGGLIANLFEETIGINVDGVIAIDPHGLAEYLRATGPLEGPKQIRLEAATFPKLIMRDGYEIFATDSGERKHFFAAAARAIFGAVLSHPDDRAVGEATARAVAARHVLVWSRVEREQTALDALGATGAFAGEARNYVGVVIQNAAGNKVDYYLRREMDIRATAKADGSASFSLALTLRNDAPASGLDVDAIGPNFPGIAAGENKTYVSLYFPRGANPSVLRIDGKESPVQTHLTPDSFILSQFVSIPSGRSSLLTIEWEMPRALEGKGRLRTLRLSVPRQPMAQPDRVRIRVEGPKGYRTRRDVVRFDGPSARVVEAEIHAPLWRRVLDLVP